MSDEVSKLQAALEEVSKFRAAAEESLGYVLLAVGEPVVVPKELLRNGVPEGSRINIYDHEEEDAFIFSVVQAVEVEDEH